ncbi:MAG: DNA-3-methyladenine glycosylase 2 family protein, partial [Naasia sp.]|nr:DNA-3-methyladenine glycosylase 2 family protein [Naasia sp.]
GVFAFLADRAVSGVEMAGPASYARSIRLSGGPAVFEVSEVAPGELVLTAQLRELRDLPALLARVRRLFDLDADPVGIDQVLGAGALAASVRAVPGIRLPGAVDGGEIVIRAIAGQQVTVPSARAMLGRFAAAAGEPFDSGVDGISTLFPEPAALPAVLDDAYRGPAARRATLRTAAEALAAGALSVHAGADPAELTASLVKLPGIGPWTAGYTVMRVLGAPDVVLTGDVALRAGARRLGLGSDVAAALAPYAPWRSYASLHLWRAALAAARKDLP